MNINQDQNGYLPQGGYLGKANSIPTAGPLNESRSKGLDEDAQCQAELGKTSTDKMKLDR